MCPTMTKPTKSEVRLCKRALFGGLGYTPHAGQWTVHRSKAPRRVVACGTRWGKSTLAAYEAIAYLLEPRDRALGWLVAPTYELTRRIADRVVSILYDHMRHRVLSYNPRAHSIVVANLGGGRSELRARSADRPAGLLGDALDFLIVDEAVMIREDTWDQYISARLIDRHGSALLLSTPTSVQSWFFRQYRRGGRDPDYEAFSMPTASNPHITPELIEAERGRLDAETFASQYLAQFSGIDVYPCDVCGGPKVGVSCVVSLHGDEKPCVCRACGKLVGKDGLTRVSLVDGKPYSTIIWFTAPSEREELSRIGVSRTLTHEPRPEYIESPEGLATQLIVLNPPIENPGELPEGVE